MTLHLPQKTYGQPLFNAPTRYRRNQALRVYIGAKVQDPPRKKKNKRPKTSHASGATTLQLPFIKRPLTLKHRFDHKQTYIAAELRSTIASIKLVLDTLTLLPESLRTRPIVFYSNSRYVLTGVTQLLPKWKANRWKSIQYTRERDRQALLQTEYSKRWSHQQTLVESYYRPPLEGIIANVELWQELDDLLAQLHSLPNRIHFRKLNRRRHLRFRKRTLVAATQALYEASLALKWTAYKKRYRNLTLEERDLAHQEDEQVIRHAHLNATHRHLTHYLRSNHGEISLLPVLTQEGSTPSVMTNTQRLQNEAQTSVGQEALQASSPNHTIAPGGSHTYASAGTNKLPARLTPALYGETAGYPIKTVSDPTSVTTLLSVDAFHEDGINKGYEATSIGDDDPSVGDFKVPQGEQKNRSEELATRSCLLGDVGKCPPPSPSHLVAAQLGTAEVT